MSKDNDNKKKLVPLEAEKVSELLRELETEEDAQEKPVSLSKTEFWQKMKRERDERLTIDNLEKDGCDFIECAFIFMALLGVPAEAIDFVLCLMGMSRGNYNDPIKASDEQLSKRMNISRKTVQKKRDTLLSWMSASTYNIVKIDKQDYDPDLGRIPSTHYTLILVPYVATFVRDTRSKEFWKKPSGKILLSAVETGTEKVVRAIAKDMPETEHRERKFYEKNKDKFQPKIPDYPKGTGSLRHAFRHDSENAALPLQKRIDAARRDARSMVRQYLDLSFNAGLPLRAAIDNLKSDFQEVVSLYFNEDTEESMRELPDF